MSNYNDSYRKRILIFMLITGVYLLFSATYTITGFFKNIPWSDNLFLYAYCTYAIWFNAYNYYQFHRNSVEEEKNEKKNEQWVFFYEVTGLTPYDYKKARRRIFLLSSLAIAINGALIIATRWLW